MSTAAARQAEDALREYDPALVELVLGEAATDAITAEGYAYFEIAAVRALVKQAGLGRVF